MKILVTGFEPFDNEKINPAWEAVKKLPNNLEDIEVLKFQIPTAFINSLLLVLNHLIMKK